MPRKGPLTPEQIASRRAASLRWYHKNKESFTEEKIAKLREAARKAGAKYREANREALNARSRERQRALRATDPDLNINACRRYRAENRDDIEARRRERWAADPERREKSNAKRRKHWEATDPTERAIGAKLRRAVHREEFPWAVLLKTAAARARKRGLPFTLTEDWARNRWTGRCEITDIEFKVRVADSPGPRVFSPSIDQIISKGGYTPENCRFVLWAVNALKHNGSDSDMLVIARAIVDNFSVKTDT